MFSNPLPSLRRPLTASLATALLSLPLIACGVREGATSSTLPRPTTTLQAETANNTSAADTFALQTNGNLGAGNVSKAPLRSLLYSGSTTKLFVTWLGWFGRSDHMSVGYRSDDPAQVHRQVEDMISRGIQGAIADWSGPNVASIESATQMLKTEAEAHAGQFEFSIMEDASALGATATANGCDVTDQLIADLSYIASHYASSPAYTRWNGRPVIFFFGVDGFYIDWPRVLSAIPGNPLLIFQGTDGFTRRLSDGGFSWININSSDPFDPELASQDDFYKSTQQAPARIAFGSAYKGFNDTMAMWGTNRVIDQHCGETWLQTFSEAGKFYSSDHQLPAIQIATWNDYEEGTAIEPGIDNCVYLVPSQSGSTIQWQISGGDENTIDHYTVFLSTDGTNLSKLADVPRGTHSVDLSALKLPTATYAIYVKAIGEPGIQNKMSPPIAWHPGDQPPAIQFNVSQTGPLTYAASTTGSSGNVARSTIDFGDGTIVSAASAAHTYAAPGTYRITASVYDQAGASSVAVQQISAKSPSGGITIASPVDGSTVNWPTMLVASANPGTPVAAMRVLIDGAQAYAAHSDTLNTSLKVFTGTHRITVQSLDAAGNVTASASVNVLAEPDDIPPIANITLKPLTSVSPTAMLGCTATSTDPDGFIMSFHLQYSDGSLFTTPAAPRTFAAPGLYKATATVMDQFGATSSSSTTFSVAGGTTPARTSPSPAPQQKSPKPLQPMRPPL